MSHPNREQDGPSLARSLDRDILILYRKLAIDPLAERAPERAFVKQLDALQARDPEAYKRTLAALHARLQG